MKEQVLSILIQLILGVVGIIAGYVLKKISNALELQKQSSIAKKGAYNYKHALNMAKGLYYVLEDEFSSLKKSGNNKKSEMEKRLLEVIPSLTQNELDAINKEVCCVVKPLVQPVEIEQVTTENTVNDKIT